MNTTNLFVELLVIGLGPVIAILLIADLAVGPGVLTGLAGLSSGVSLTIAIPMLGLMYVVGVMTDRVADQIFRGWSKRVRRTVFETDGEYHEARRTIVVGSELLYSLRQYGRSRLRIARGWAFNGALLIVVGNIWLSSSTGEANARLAMNALLTTLFLGSLYSWRSLAASEYQKIREGAEFLTRRSEGRRISEADPE